MNYNQTHYYFFIAKSYGKINTNTRILECKHIKIKNIIFKKVLRKWLISSNFSGCKQTCLLLSSEKLFPVKMVSVTCFRRKICSWSYGDIKKLQLPIAKRGIINFVRTLKSLGCKTLTIYYKDSWINYK